MLYDFGMTHRDHTVENETGKNTEIVQAKEIWKKSLGKLAEITAKALEADELITSTGTKLFRGTAVCDVLYAILEKDGELISPLSYLADVEPQITDSLGTIMTNNVAEAVALANNQIKSDDVAEKKYRWMSEVTGLTVQDVKQIGGLWQPVVLELTSNIPDLWVEGKNAEIWTKQPINILEGALSDKTIKDLTAIIGIDLKDLQRPAKIKQSDEEIDRIIKLSEIMNEYLWEKSITDEVIHPDIDLDEYWKEEAERLYREQFDIKEVR